MPPNDETAIKGRSLNGRNDSNECGDNSEVDFGEDVKRFYIKRPIKCSRSFPSANLFFEDISLMKLQKINVSQNGYVRGSEDD
jgi:hypothetical protein